MLTERQKRFVEEWNGPGTGLAAARSAGYQGSDETLKVRASQLLRSPEVARAIEDRLARVGGVDIVPAPDVVDVGQALTEQEAKFVEAYVASGVTRQAARTAGYPETEGWKLRREPHVRAAIEEGLADRRERTVATRLLREEFYTRVMEGEITETRFDSEGNGYDTCPVMVRLAAGRELGRVQGDYTKSLVPSARAGGDGGTTVRARNAVVFVDNRRGPAAAGGAGG